MKWEDVEIGETYFCSSLNKHVVATNKIRSSPRVEVKPQTGGKRWVETHTLSSKGLDTATEEKHGEGPRRLNDATIEEWDKASKIVYNNNEVDLESEMIREGVAKFEEEAKLSVEEYVYKIDPDELEGVKHDWEKPDMDLIPPRIEEEVAKVLTFGAQKYSAENWRKVRNLHTRYRAAAKRHINALKRGEMFDEESGLHHAAHAISCLMFIGEIDLEGRKE